MNNICRVCLKSIEAIEFFNVAYEIEAKWTILETLIDFANIEVRDEDRLPKYICKNCKEKVTDFIEFRNTIVTSDKYLKRINVSNTENPEVKLEFIKVEEPSFDEKSVDQNNVTVKTEPEFNNIDESYLEMDSLDIKEELDVENVTLPNNGDAFNAATSASAVLSNKKVKHMTLDQKKRAIKNKKYIAKLKINQKYEEFKKKRAAAMREYREKRKKMDDILPSVIEEQRKASRERVRRHRQRKKEILS